MYPSGTLDVVTSEADLYPDVPRIGCGVRVETAAEQLSPASLMPAIEWLERIREGWKARFKPHALPEVVIGIFPKGRHRALGWYSQNRWADRDGGRLPEINLCAEHLNRDLYEIVETLVHELVHHVNFSAGFPDCSANQYHNGRFKSLGERVGLTFPHGRHPRFGWGITGLADWARAEVDRLGVDPAAFAVFRQDAAGPTKAAKAKLMRWDCGRPAAACCPPAWVAAGSPFPAVCTGCGRGFAPRPRR